MDLAWKGGSQMGGLSDDIRLNFSKETRHRRSYFKSVWHWLAISSSTKVIPTAACFSKKSGPIKQLKTGLKELNTKTVSHLFFFFNNQHITLFILITMVITFWSNSCELRSWFSFAYALLRSVLGMKPPFFTWWDRKAQTYGWSAFPSVVLVSRNIFTRPW